MPEKKNTGSHSLPALLYIVKKPLVRDTQVQKSWQAIHKRINSMESGDDQESKNASDSK